MIDNPKIQRSAVAVLSLLALFLLAKTIAEVKEWPYIGKDVPTQSTITVSGKGEVLEIPDIATFSFGVTEESFDVAKAQEDSAKAVNAIISFLEENGVEKRDIKTSGYNIYPRYEYEKYGYPVPPGKQTLGAYVVTQSISVKVRKIAEAGKLISGIGERGATEISGLSFSIDKEEEFKKEAREKAIQKRKRTQKHSPRIWVFGSCAS